MKRGLNAESEKIAKLAKKAAPLVQREPVEETQTSKVSESKVETRIENEHAGTTKEVLDQPSEQRSNHIGEGKEEAETDTMKLTEISVSQTEPQPQPVVAFVPQNVETITTQRSEYKRFGAALEKKTLRESLAYEIFKQRMKMKRLAELSPLWAQVHKVPRTFEECLTPGPSAPLKESHTRQCYTAPKDDRKNWITRISKDKIERRPRQTSSHSVNTSMYKSPPLKPEEQMSWEKTAHILPEVQRTSPPVFEQISQLQGRNHFVGARLDTLPDSNMLPQQKPFECKEIPTTSEMKVMLERSKEKEHDPSRSVASMDANSNLVSRPGVKVPMKCIADIDLENKKKGTSNLRQAVKRLTICGICDQFFCGEDRHKIHVATHFAAASRQPTKDELIFFRSELWLAPEKLASS